MRYTIIPVTVFFIVFSLLLSSCGSPTPTPAPTTISSDPTQPAIIPSISVIPTPSSSDMVTITGVLLENRESPRPAEGAILYLAEVIYSEEQGAPLIAGFDRKTSKSTQTDGNGRFVFTDVDPITYSIVLDRIYEAYLLADPNDGTDLLIEPVPGQIFDMGELVYASLPGFSPVP